MLRDIKNMGYMSYKKAVEYVEKNKKAYDNFLEGLRWNSFVITDPKILEARLVIEEQMVQNFLNYKFKKPSN